MISTDFEVFNSELVENLNHYQRPLPKKYTLLNLFGWRRFFIDYMLDKWKIVRNMSKNVINYNIKEYMRMMAAKHSGKEKMHKSTIIVIKKY